MINLLKWLVSLHLIYKLISKQVSQITINIDLPFFEIYPFFSKILEYLKTTFLSDWHNFGPDYNLATLGSNNDEYYLNHFLKHEFMNILNSDSLHGPPMI